MNEIRSWDRVASPTTSAHFDGGTTPIGNSWVADDAVPVRVVVWPEGAPDPSTVPQAGEEVISSASGEKGFVVNGIPVIDRDRNTRVWCLLVENPFGYRSSPYVRDLTIVKDTKPEERTFTVAQVREAFTGIIVKDVDSFIHELEGS